MLDVNDEEARKLLLTIDPLAALAEADKDVLAQLAAVTRADSQVLNDFWNKIAAADAEATAATSAAEDAETVREQYLVLVECRDRRNRSSCCAASRRRASPARPFSAERTLSMPEAQIILETPIVETPRVLQVRGLFDLERKPPRACSGRSSCRSRPEPWNVGLLVGPSGCGKSTIARHLFGDALAAQQSLDSWPTDRSLLDAFPEEMPVKDVVALLSSVGFSSPPAWLRPFHVLSTGQQFRAPLARLLAAAPGLAVMDEYTSVVDRTVAQVGSAAVAKTVRARGQQFIAVTCHEDVEAWLQPDWTYRPAEGVFQWRCLQRRPTITLTIFRCRPAAWRLFHHHHYLSGTLAPGAVCFLAEWQGQPVAFSAWVNALTRKGGKREHRTVTLPDYQGVGIGHALSGFCAGLWKALGQRATSTTTHPAFVRLAFVRLTGGWCADRRLPARREKRRSAHPPRHHAPDGRIRVRRSRSRAGAARRLLTGC